jgi:hypothetical protein
MSKLRVTVEWRFKDLVSNFKFLKFKWSLELGKSPVALYYIVGAELTNAKICIQQRSQASQYFGIAPPTIHEYCASRPDVQADVEILPNVRLVDIMEDDVGEVVLHPEDVSNKANRARWDAEGYHPFPDVHHA